MSLDDGHCHIDLTGLRRSADGDDAFLRELVLMIHDDIEVRRGKLVESLAEEDMPSVKRFAHTLKGHALHVGASMLAEIARNIERAAADGNPIFCRLNLEALETEAAAVRADLQQVLQGGDLNR